MKLLELTIERLSRVPDRTYSFGDARGNPLDVVLLAGDEPTSLLEIIASLLEAVRLPAPTPHRLAWWARWRGSAEARLAARWALTAGEAAWAGLPAQTAVSEWLFGPEDRLPREVQVEGALPRRLRTRLGRYVHVDTEEIAVWLGADPLTELLAQIARQDAAATRAAYRPGVGIVGYSMPDTFAAITRAIAPVCRGLRIERVSPTRGGAPVACFRDGVKVELDQVPDVERNTIHLFAAIHASNLRGGVVLVRCPEFHTPADARARWFDWLSASATQRQLQFVVA